MWAHSHVGGTPFQQSSTACLLEQIDLVPSLIGAEERAIVRAVGTHFTSCACHPSPNSSVGIQGQEPGNQLLVVSGTGQHPANADGHFAAGEGPAMECTRGQVRRRVNSRLLPCWCPFRTRDRTARVGHHCSNRQGGEALPRPRCWRPARRVQPQRGHLCGWPEHNYCRSPRRDLNARYRRY